MPNLYRGLAVLFGIGWVGTSFAWWFAGFVAYFNNFQGLAKLAGLFVAPVLALPIIGKGELGENIPVRGFYWWWVILISAALGYATGLFLHLAKRAEQSRLD